MADEESAGGLEAVIKVTLDDSGLEGEAQAAVEKVQSVTKGKRATVQATVEIDGAQVAAEIEKKTRGKRSTVKVKPVVEDADIAALKQRFNLAQMALAGARQGVGDQSKPKDERALLHAAIPKLQALVDDIPKAIAKREGRPSAAPSAPVTTERVNEVARQVGAAMRGRPVERPAASTTPASSPVVVVRSSGGSTSAPVNTGRSVRARPVHGAGPGAIAQLIRQLSPTFAAFESGGSPEIEALDAYYQALDKERGKEQRARERATPSAALARATARVPTERTTRRRPLPPVREPDSIISGPTTPPFMEGNPVLGISPVYREGEELRASSPGAAGRRRSRRDPSKETPNKGRIITRDAAPILPGALAEARLNLFRGGEGEDLMTRSTKTESREVAPGMRLGSYGAFGPGTYLSSDRSVAQRYAKQHGGRVGEASILASRHLDLRRGAKLPAEVMAELSEKARAQAEKDTDLAILDETTGGSALEVQAALRKHGYGAFTTDLFDEPETNVFDQALAGYQVGSAETAADRYRRNRKRAESDARRSEAPVSEDTFNPIGERFRQSAPRYSQSPIAAGEELGRPSARGKGGKRAGDQAPLPRGELGRIFRQFQAGQFEDFFQPWDETGKRALGPPERAAGSLAQRIKLDDPKYEQFRHEGRYLQRVSPKAIAASEREQYLAQLSETSKIPQLGLIGLGPLGSARTSRRRIGFDQLVQEHPEYAEMPLAELKRQDRRLETDKEYERRRRKAQRDRQQTASRTTEDVINFNMWLQASRSGEGQAGRTGHINVGGSVLPDIPTRLSPLTRMLRGTQERQRAAEGGVPERHTRRGAPPSLQRFYPPDSERPLAHAPVKTTIQRPDNKERLDKAAGRRDVPVFDPTAPSGQAAKTVTDTGANVLDAALSRDVAEVVNPRMAQILEGLREGQTMTDVGRLGREGDAPILASNTKRRGQKDTLKRTSETMLDSRRLSPGQTAMHRFGQLVYDLTKSAGYSERSARKYQLDPKTVGSAKRLDPALRTYLSGARESIYGQMAAGRDAADALDPLQRDPMARGEKTRTWTPSYVEQQEIEAKLKGTPDNPGILTRLSKNQATLLATDSGPTMSEEDKATLLTERAALKRERDKLYRRRLKLRKQDEVELAEVAQRTGGVLQGERGGIRGYATRDRTQARAIAGQRLGGIDELVPSRRPSSFGEGRADSGDVFAATAAGAASQAGTNLGPTEERPAEAPIRRSKLKGKERFKLQDTTGKSAGAPPVIPVAAASAGGAGEAPPPRDIATAPSAGDGGGKGLRDGIRVIVTNWKQFDFGQGAAAKIAAKERADPSFVRARKAAEEYERRATAHEPGQTTAATAARLLAAQESSTPGMSTKDKQQFLREMGFTKSESSEFSGADEEKAAKKSGRATAKPKFYDRDRPISREDYKKYTTLEERNKNAEAAVKAHPAEPEKYPTDDEEIRRRREIDDRKRAEAAEHPRFTRADIWSKMRMVPGPQGPSVRLAPDTGLKNQFGMGYRVPEIQFDEKRQKYEERLGKVRKAAEDEEKRASGGAPGKPQAAQTRTHLLNILRGQGIDLTETKPEPRSYEGKSPERIQAESEILEARSLNPTRAFQTAVAAAFAKTLGGGGAFEKRVKGLNDALNKRSDAREDYDDTRRQLKALNTDLGGARKRMVAMSNAGEQIPSALREYAKSLEGERHQLVERAAAQRSTRDDANTDVAQRRRGLITPMGVARGFAMLGAGAIVGGMIFTAAQQAIQTVMTVLVDQAGRAADSLMGFGATANRVAAALSGSFGQSRAAGTSAIAGMAGQGRLGVGGLNDVSSALASRASAFAARDAMEQRMDMFKSASGITSGNQAYGGYDQSLFRNTGGLNITSNSSPLSALSRAAGINDISIGGEKSFAETLEKGIRATFTDQKPGPGDLASAALDQGKYTENFGIKLANTNKTIDSFNESLKGSEFLVTKTADEAAVTQQYDQAVAAGGPSGLFGALKEKGIKIEGLDPTDIKSIGKFLETLGGQSQDPRVLFEQDKRSFAMQAQSRAFDRELTNELGNSIPRDLALSNLAAPPKEVGAGIVAAGTTKGETAAEQKTINDGLKGANALQAELNSRYQAGNEILKNILPPDLFASIESTGKAIAAIQTGIAKEQGALQAAEYSNQLRIAKRTLSDIAGLSGKNNGYGKSQVGIVERENVMLARQSELLSQMLQQRQINFQLAIAGFKVGGESGEERAARIKDAKTQAEFAQKQLDISKKTFGNNIKLFDLQNVRAATDAIASIGLLKQGRAVAIDTALAEEKLSRLSKLQADNVKRAGAYIDKVDKRIGMAQAEIYKLEVAAGHALGDLGNEIIGWFATNINKMYGIISDQQGAQETASQTRNAAHGNASGFLGNVSGATSMIMGEAGTETVAILRNPRQATLSGGGGGGVTININHPVVRNDQDINKITASVVRAINTRTALLGLR